MALEGVRGQRHAPAAIYPGKDPISTVQKAGCAPRPVWTGAENLVSTGIPSPDHPARSQSLYRLSYPAHICLHLKYPLVLSDFDEILILNRFFEKYSHINFRDNPFSWSQVVPCGRTDERIDWQTGRQTDMTKLLVAFWNFTKASKNLVLILLGDQFLFFKWGAVYICSRPVDWHDLNANASHYSVPPSEYQLTESLSGFRQPWDRYRDNVLRKTELNPPYINL